MAQIIKDSNKSLSDAKKKDKKAPDSASSHKLQVADDMHVTGKILGRKKRGDADIASVSQTS